MKIKPIMFNNSYFKSHYSKIVIFLVISTILGLSIITQTPYDQNTIFTRKNYTNLSPKNKFASLNSSNPITISNDTDFKNQAQTNGWLGNGSAINPYIIENLSIINSSSSAIGIYISDFVLSTHFIIRNNYISMTGTGSIGIELYGVSNLGIIKNNTLYNNANYGILLSSSTGNTITNNTFDSNQNSGLYVAGDYNIVENNIFRNNYDGLSVSGSSYSSFTNNSFSNSTNFDFIVAGNFYFDNITNNDLTGHGNTIMYFTSGYTYNVTFSGNTFVNGGYGVRFLSNLVNFSIYNNYFFNNNNNALEISGSPTNLEFYNNIFENNYIAVYGNLGSAQVHNNYFSGNVIGIRLSGSSNAIFENNNFYNAINNVGIDFYSSSSGNIIVNNNFVNVHSGIYFEDSASLNNVFYSNNFINSSTANIASTSSTNKADNGSYGNFWSDYFTSYYIPIDANHDGIADSSYTPPGSVVIVDHYPLMIWHNLKLPLYLLNYYANFTYNLDGPSMNLTWKILDESPAYYQIYNDGSLVKSGSWISYESLNATLPTVFGVYNYTFIANDTDGNVRRNMFFVTVADTSAPRINGISPYIYKEGTSNQMINWNITDAFPDTYVVYKNSTIIDQNTWTSGMTVYTNITGLMKGSYNYTLFVNDTSGNSNIYTTMVLVYDGTPPMIADGGNITVEAGSNVSLNWTASDNYPAYYLLYNNSIVIANNTWTSNVNISQALYSLSLGTYNFTIKVFDSSGNNVTDTVFVTFEDTIAPTIIMSPGNKTFSNSSSGHILTWKATDYFPSKYIVYINGNPFANNSWLKQNVSINLDSLGVGLYNVTIVFNDTTGNLITDTVWVAIIVDTSAPQIITASSNTSIRYGTTGNTLSWIAIDNLGPANYTLYINGSIIENNFWMNNSLLMISIDGFATGLYNVTILFYDTANNSSKSTVWLTVLPVDNNPPIIAGVTSYMYELGTTGNKLAINATDDNPSTFALIINGSLNKNNSWVSGKAIIVDLNTYNLKIGSYNFTFVFADSFGNTATHIVIVVVFSNSIQSQVSGSSSQSVSTTNYNKSRNTTAPWEPIILFLSFNFIILLKKKRKF